MKKQILFLALALALAACSGEEKKSDAYGNFEVDEVVISAQTPGEIIHFNVNENDNLKKGEIVALIDTTQLHLQKLSLRAKKKAVSSKIQSVIAQIKVIEEQIQTAEKNRQRIQKMTEEGAATPQQLDEINGKIAVLEKQIQSIKTQNAAIFSEIEATETQIKIIDDKIDKSVIKNPIDGTVLNTYAEARELAAPGKNLYQIAGLDYLNLRVFVSGAQLPNIKLGQKVEVIIDKNADENSKLEGEIIWISPKTEFTPKIIQTKDERVNMVYAVKVRVKNDGTLKIGMPGEVNF